jgi:hypothetical protein
VITSSAATYPEAVTKLGELGAVTVTKTIGAAAPNPIVTREFERDLNAYLGGLSGTTTNSLAEIVAYNEDNRVEGLKYRQGELTAAAGVDLNDLTQKAAYEADLATGKAADKATIDAILNNGTGGDPSDDLDLIAVPQGNALVGIADRAGYPVLTVPAGYGTGTAGRDPIGIVFVAAAFDEAELLADGYAFEQGTDVRELGPDYNPTSPGIQPLDGGSGSPSYTNPSMWRCVQLSEFYLPHHCRPGTVEPLTMVAPTNVPPTPPAPPAGAPKLRIKVAPKARTVGPDRKTAGFRLIVKNVGDATSGEVRLCASAPAKRLKVLGKKCIVVEIAAGASRERSVTAKIKPAAVGALTKITFTARGIVVGEMQTKAQLTVKEG